MAARGALPAHPLTRDASAPAGAPPPPQRPRSGAAPGASGRSCVVGCRRRPLLLTLLALLLLASVAVDAQPTAQQQQLLQQQLQQAQQQAQQAQLLQQQKQQQQQQQNGGAQPAAAAAAVTKPKGKKALAAAAAKAAAAAAVAPAAAAAAAPMAATPATPAAATPVAISTARLGLRTRYVTPTATAATATVNAPTKPKKASAKAAKHNKKAAALAAAIAAGNVTNTTTAPLNTKDTLLNLHYLSEFSAYQHFSNAICNDASVPGFYHGIATNPQLAHIWVVYLQGGGFCYDAESCDARMRATPWLVSSQMVSSATMGVPTLKPRWPAQIHMGGIFGNDLRRNPLAGANMIYVPYCSSDLWVGNAGLDSSFNALRRVTNAMGYPGWSFRGQYILKATLAVLVDHFGLGVTHGHRLLLSGCDEGAFGALANLDFVNGMVPPGVEVRGLVDSPWATDLEPLLPSTDPMDNQTALLYATIGARARLSNACFARYRRTGEEWKCLFGPTRLPFVQLPFLLSVSQFNAAQLRFGEGSGPPYHDVQAEYADQFQTAVRTTVSTLPNKLQRNSAVYSSACYVNCTTTTDKWWQLRVGPYALKDFFSLWYFGTNLAAAASVAPLSATLPLGVPPQLIEACEGFGCGQCTNATYDATNFSLPYTGFHVQRSVQGDAEEYGERLATVKTLALAVLGVAAICVVCVVRVQRTRATDSGGVELGDAAPERMPLVAGEAPRGSLAASVRPLGHAWGEQQQARAKQPHGVDDAKVA